MTRRRYRVRERAVLLPVQDAFTKHPVWFAYLLAVVLIWGIVFAVR